jgi:FkbM family methyltransferase
MAGVHQTAGSVGVNLYWKTQSVALRRGWSTRLFFSLKDALHGKRRHRLEQLLAPFNIQRDDVVVDCGANVGNVSAALLSMGARVYAFEPNPHVFRIIEQRFKSSGQRIQCIPKGVWSSCRTSRLFHSPLCADDPARWGVSSSVVEDKPNVSAESYSQIELVDINDFIVSLNCRVKLLKLDIEGGEFEVIEHLIEQGGIDRIDFLVAETHEKIIPSLRPKREALLQLVQGDPTLHSKIYLDWI